MLIFASLLILIAGNNVIINGNIVVRSTFFYASGSIGLAIYLFTGLFGYFAGYYRSVAWSYLYLFALFITTLWLLFYTVSFETFVNCDHSESPECYSTKAWPHALFYIITATNAVILVAFISCAGHYIGLLTAYRRKHGELGTSIKVNIPLDNVDTSKLTD
jgi:hypothetical protein